MQDQERRSKAPTPDTRASSEGRKYSFNQRRDTTEGEDRVLSPGKSRISGGSSYYFNALSLKSSHSINPKLQKEEKESNSNLKKHIEGSFKCECNVCKIENRNNKKEEVKINPTLDFFHNFDFHAPVMSTHSEKDFVFILRKLIPPKELPYTLRFLIPETVALIEGEVKFIALAEKDKRLRFIRNRERLGLLEVKRFFREYQKRKENELSQYEEKVNHPKLDTQSSRKQSVFHHGKLEKKGTDSSIHEALTRSSLSKAKTMGKQKDVIHIPTSARSKNKEVALIKYTDDTTTVLTEVELDNLLLKRKEDSAWQKIQYLQLYVATKKYMDTLQRIYFVYERDKNDPLYERSRWEIKYLNGDIPKASQHYIPLHEEEQFEDELSNADPKKFYLYLLMKIHHFLEIFWGLRITKMGGDFMRDSLGATWLINISRVHCEKLKIEIKVNQEDSDMDEVEIKQGDGNTDDPSVNQPLIRLHPRGIGKHDALKVMRRVMRPKSREKAQLGSKDESDTKDFVANEASADFQPISPVMLKNRGNRLSLDSQSLSIGSSPKRSRNLSRRSLMSISGSRPVPMKPNYLDQSERRIEDSEIRRRPKPLYLKNGYSLTNEGSMLTVIARSTEFEMSSSCKSGQKYINLGEQSPTFATASRGPQTTKNFGGQQTISVKMALQHLRQSSGIAWQGSPNQRSSLTGESTWNMEGTFAMENNTSTNQRHETIDLTKITMNSTHTQWVKNLNHKIREKITAQLGPRRFVKKNPNTALYSSEEKQ